MPPDARTGAADVICPGVNCAVRVIAVGSGFVIVAGSRAIREQKKHTVADHTCGIWIGRIHHRHRQQPLAIVSRRQIGRDCVVGSIDILAHSLVQDARLTLLGPVRENGLNVSADSELLNLNEIENFLRNDAIGIAAPKPAVAGSPI